MKSLLILFICLEILGFAKDSPFHEVRLEIEDLKHTVHGLQVDLNLLDSKWKQGLSSEDKKCIEQLDKKIHLIERTQEKINQDLSAISNHLNKSVDKITSVQNHYQEEIGKLKEALTSLVGMIKTGMTGENSIVKYKVRSGDSLEKIAKAHHIHVEALKRENRLMDDRIFVGQELLIPK